ncbi:MAG: hypothetical protein R3A48_24035 [Polyangiales bacterium]
MARSSVRLPHTVRHFNSGALATGFFGVFLGMALLGLARLLIGSAGLSAPVAYGACAALALALLSALYFFFSTELVATVDAEGLRVTSQSRVGPIRGRLDTLVNVRWDRVQTVREVTQSSITKHGNVQKSYKLKVGGQTLEGALLGTMGRDGLYLELLDAIRLAIGDRLVAHEDLGELDGAVRRVVDSRRGGDPS